MKQSIHKIIALVFLIIIFAPLSAFSAVDATGLPSLHTLSTQKTLQTLSRDTDNAHKALGKIFDKKKVAEQQEAAKVFGELAFSIAGDLAKSFKKPYEDAQTKLINAQLAAQAAQANGDDAALAKAQTDIDTATAQMKAYKADYDTWKDGSGVMIALHTVVGGIQAKYGGGNAFSGGLGAGLNEAAIPLADKMFDGMSKDQQNALRQWASVIIGGAAAKLTGGNTNDAMTGAATALDGEKYNRQLHQSEIDKAKQYADQFKKYVKSYEGVDITEDEATGRLAQQMLRWADYETAKADGFRQDLTATSFLGKSIVQVTDAEYYNPNINQDIKQRNLDIYAKAEAQSNSGLTPGELRQKNLPNEIAGKAVIAAVGGYLIAPAIGTIVGVGTIETATILRTGTLLDMISSGEVATASGIMQQMANTPAGRAELLQIHNTVSQLVPNAINSQAANTMKTLQSLSGTLARGGK